MLIQAVSGLDWTGQCGKLSVGASKFRKDLIWMWRCSQPEGVKRGSRDSSVYALARPASRSGRMAATRPAFVSAVSFLPISGSARMMTLFKTVGRYVGFNADVHKVLDGASLGRIQEYIWRCRDLLENAERMMSLTSWPIFSLSVLVYCAFTVFTPKFMPVFKPLKSCQVFFLLLKKRYFTF